MFSEDKTTWQIEELSLEAFEGYQTWIDFRVVTANGGGQGVLIDESEALPLNFIRFYVGLEDSKFLIKDIEKALN